MPFFASWSASWSRRAVFLSLSAALAFVTLAGCGASIDSAAKADLDRQLAGLPRSEETYPPSAEFLPLSFAVGQWTQHRLVDGKGGSALITSKLVGEESGGYWLETVTESYAGRDVVKMQVVLLAGRDPAGMEIRAVRTKHGKDPVVDVDPGDLPAARLRYRGALDLLAVSFDSDQKDDAHVRAGRFIGCFKTQTTGAWGPLNAPTLLCSHPSVPLSGVVQAQAVGGPGLLELVGFGVSGAASEL